MQIQLSVFVLRQNDVARVAGDSELLEQIQLMSQGVQITAGQMLF